ncbi:MAG TPA: hypothetical protein VFU07_09695 [Candidatus Lumbricidophila sp.]|nr:hypothetical protein [Candidatus Lumbricidophila sp.]
MTEPTLTDLLDEANWLEFRARIPAPAQVTDLVTTDQTRAEFVTGCRLLRLDKRKRIDSDQMGPTPIQLMIADMLNGGRFMNAVLEPRRTTKTTSIEAVILGRCTHREDYQVGWTLATLGSKASERFRKDIVVHLERAYPDRSSRPFKVNVGKGTEHIAWPNGSFLNVYAPSGDGFRSGGFDFAWVDEGGEADPDLSEDLTIAVLPTMDTKPGAQFVVSGTAAKYRGGNLLWDTLYGEGAGVIQHAIPDNTDPEELEAWEPDADHPKARVRKLIEMHHPGVGFTSTLENVKRNFDKFPREKFLAEYLGVFGSEGSNIGLIAPGQWERSTVGGEPPAPPKRFTLAIAIHPDGLWASCAAAWRYDETPDDLVAAALALDGMAPAAIPRVGVGLLWHQNGVQGFANRVLAFARKHKTPIIYDQLSQSVGVEVETLSRAIPRPTLTPATTSDVRRGATKTLKLLDDDTLRHWRTPALDRAAEIAVKRPIGTAGGFGFGRPKGDYAADITPIEAVSLALQFLDDTQDQAKVDVVFG